jgi:hypothetical protein
MEHEIADGQSLLEAKLAQMDKELIEAEAKLTKLLAEREADGEERERLYRLHREKLGVEELHGLVEGLFQSQRAMWKLLKERRADKSKDVRMATLEQHIAWQNQQYEQVRQSGQGGRLRPV